MFKPYTYQREEVCPEFEETLLQINDPYEDMNYGWTQEVPNYSPFFEVLEVGKTSL